jgi:hypothetical protein
MEKIKLFEDFKHKEIHDFFNDGINPTMYWAYRKSCAAGNDILDFNDVIWEHDIQPIVDTCNNVGITEFTISSQFTGLLKTIHELDKRGFKTVGVTEVRASYMDFYKQDNAIVPAVHIRKISVTEE